jgi:hypothetical protein
MFGVRPLPVSERTKDKVPLAEHARSLTMQASNCAILTRGDRRLKYYVQRWFNGGD